MAIGRRRGPMSAAQKLALKKAQEASARARRKLGGDEPSKPRKAAKAADSDAARSAAKKGISSERKAYGVGTKSERTAKTVRAEYLKAVQNGEKEKAAKLKREFDMLNRPRQTPGGSKPAMGTADPGTMGVSQILKERKELIAKKNSEGLSKEEAARLVAIQAESALRHQNRKAGKGTGPTKIALGDKKAAQSDSARSAASNPYKKPDAAPPKTKAKRPTADMAKIMEQTGKSSPQDVLDAADRRRSLHWMAYLAKDLDRALKSGDTAEADRIRKRINEVGNISSKKPSDYNDKTTFGQMDSVDRKKFADMRREMQNVANKWINREGVSSALNNANTVGEMVDAALDIYWYLDEMDGYGNKTDAARKVIDPLFTELKRYSDRYRQKSTAGVRQPTFNRRTRMSGRG